MKKLLGKVMGVSLVLMLLAAPAMALTQDAPKAAEAATIAFKSDGSLFKGILNGLIGGVIASLMGWVKNRNSKTGEIERFEIKYLVPTAIVGAVVGVAAAIMKMSPADLLTTLELSPIFGAVVFAAEAGLKAIWRNTVPLVRDMINDVKTGAGNPTPPAPPQQ